MELLFNLLWLALSCLLLGFWLLRRKRWTDDPLRSSLAIQLVALALLIVVLLPVISLTDDLHVQIMPAESEHLSRPNDFFQTIADFSLHAVSVITAASVTLDASSQRRTYAWLSFPAEEETPSVRYLRIRSTRPPPAV